MKAIITSILVLSAALSCQCAWEREWREWKTKYGRQYASAQDETMSRDVWTRNMAYIQAHNNRTDVTFTLAMNQFGDKVMKLNGALLPKEITTGKSRDLSRHSQLFQPPSSWDWRTKGVISTVQNQGQLGDAAAFAVTECLESVDAIRTGRLVSLSKQETQDCCTHQMLEPDVYECIAKLGGLCTESTYPPSGTDTCRSAMCTPVSTSVKETVHIPKGDEQAMVTAVLISPLLVYLDASHASFQFYTGGIYNSPSKSCGTNIDHAMQLVGYGQEEGELYWILKNSWGATWGKEGYMWMKRGSNVCGVASYAMYPR